LDAALGPILNFNLGKNQMNILKEMELAMWEMAEAMRHEGMAQKLRYDASKRVSAVHAEMNSAVKRASAGTPSPAQLEQAFREATNIHTNKTPK